MTESPGPAQQRLNVLVTGGSGAALIGALQGTGRLTLATGVLLAAGFVLSG